MHYTFSQTTHTLNHWQNNKGQDGTIALPFLYISGIIRDGTPYTLPYTLYEPAAVYNSDIGYGRNLSIYNIIKDMTPVASGKFTVNGATYYRAIFNYGDITPTAETIQIPNGVRVSTTFAEIAKSTITAGEYYKSDTTHIIDDGTTNGETGGALIPKYHRYITFSMRTTDTDGAPDFVKNYPTVEETCSGTISYQGIYTIPENCYIRAPLELKPALLNVHPKVNKDDIILVSSTWHGYERGSFSGCQQLYNNNINTETPKETDYTAYFDTYYAGFTGDQQTAYHTTLGFTKNTTLYAADEENVSGGTRDAYHVSYIPFQNASELSYSWNEVYEGAVLTNNDPKTSTFYLFPNDADKKNMDNIATFGIIRVLYDFDFIDNFVMMERGGTLE